MFLFNTANNGNFAIMSLSLVGKSLAGVAIIIIIKKNYIVSRIIKSRLLFSSSFFSKVIT
jgi:hypothetical protein